MNKQFEEIWINQRESRRNSWRKQTFKKNINYLSDLVSKFMVLKSLYKNKIKNTDHEKKKY